MCDFMRGELERMSSSLVQLAGGMLSIIDAMKMLKAVGRLGSEATGIG